jgi:hypothetical protein
MGPQNGGVVDRWSLLEVVVSSDFIALTFFPWPLNFICAPIWQTVALKIVLFSELLPLELMGRNGRDEGEHWSMAATSIEFYLHHFLICSQSYPVHVLLSGGSRIQVYLVTILQLALRRGESGDIGLRYWKFSGEKFHQLFSYFFIQKLNVQILCTKSLALYCFGARKLAETMLLKCWWNWVLMKIFCSFFVR